MRLGVMRPPFLYKLAEALAEQFRLVWNARGAADIVKVEAELTSRMGDTASESYVKHLDRALPSLDRQKQNRRMSPR